MDVPFHLITSLVPQECPNVHVLLDLEDKKSLAGCLAVILFLQNNGHYLILVMVG